MEIKIGDKVSCKDFPNRSFTVIAMFGRSITLKELGGQLKITTEISNIKKNE